VSIKEQIERIERIHYLIKKRGTGTPEELCKKLGISRRQLFRVLDFLKNDIHAPIEYSKSRRTYFYFDSGDMTFMKWIPDKPTEDIKQSKNHRVNYSNK
jgi:predicted DNA-binding transcriptional regulator YafY